MEQALEQQAVDQPLNDGNEEPNDGGLVDFESGDYDTAGAMAFLLGKWSSEESRAKITGVTGWHNRMTDWVPWWNLCEWRPAFWVFFLLLLF